MTMLLVGISSTHSGKLTFSSFSKSYSYDIPIIPRWPKKPRKVLNYQVALTTYFQYPMNTHHFSVIFRDQTPAQASRNAMATGILQQRRGRQRRGRAVTRAVTGAQAAQGCGGFGSHQAAVLVLGAVLKGEATVGYISMEVLQKRWFIIGKILIENGWWTGVPLFLENLHICIVPTIPSLNLLIFRTLGLNQLESLHPNMKVFVIGGTDYFLET